MITTFEDAKVGDRVWCVYNGWQTIIKITNFSNTYPIETDKTLYTYDGRISANSGRTLFWDEVVITPPEKPLPKLEVDTKVLVWDTSHTEKTKAYFSHFDKHGKAVTFRYGRTSWSRNNDETLFTWQHWELPKDEQCQDS